MHKIYAYTHSIYICIHICIGYIANRLLCLSTNTLCQMTCEWSHMSRMPISHTIIK